MKFNWETFMIPDERYSLSIIVIIIWVLFLLLPFFFLMYRWYAWSRELQNVHFPSSAHVSSSVLAHKVGTSKSQV